MPAGWREQKRPMEFQFSASTNFLLHVTFIRQDHELCQHQIRFPITRLKRISAMFLLRRGKKGNETLPQLPLEHKMKKLKRE